MLFHAHLWTTLSTKIIISTFIFQQESETVEEINIRLKGEVQRLRKEKDKLQHYLTDTKHRSTCKHTRKPGQSKSLSSINNLTAVKIPELLLTSPCSSPSQVLLQNASPSSYCSSSSSPTSFTSLMSPSDSKDFVNQLHFSPSVPYSSPLTVLPATPTVDSVGSSSNNSCNSFSTINVASTAGSLECIEPTIPLDTASSSSTKVTTSKYKAVSSTTSNSYRYHPYMCTPETPLTVTSSSSQSSSNQPYHYQRTMMKQEPILSYNSNNDGNDVTMPCSTSQYSEINAFSREYDINQGTSSQSYTCTNTDLSTIDSKTNPFLYPVTNDGFNSNNTNENEPELTPLEVTQHPSATLAVAASFRNEFRAGKVSRPCLQTASTNSLSRYSPYSLSKPHELSQQMNCNDNVHHHSTSDGSVVSSESDMIISTSGCAGQYNNNSLANPFFPPCTYSNL